jgi:dienelactone hydrolase
VAKLRQAGKDVLLTEYEGAHHGFDNPAVPLRRSPQAQTVWRCRIAESSGVMVNEATGKAFTWADACVERGATLGYDAAAHAQAIKDVTAVLRQEFSLASP